jgi:formylglycine-generating enzyme required for sulfatase activity
MPTSHSFSPHWSRPWFFTAIVCLYAAGSTSQGLLAQDPKAALEPTRKLTWAKVPAGRFMMGSQVPIEQILKDYAQYRPKKEVFQDEYPRHTVEITKPFLMSTTASLA